MMLDHWDVTQNIVISMSIFARSEVPRLLLGVICPSFETFQFVVKVNDVKGLFVSECTVLSKS
jgi:hypothetical protein